jgi:TetR/AcrR family transcriptional repressor of nem operon
MGKEQMNQPTREKILDVVFELVYIHGYNGTSMSMILKECGIPKGSLYHHFKSKKDMVLAVIKERLSPRMDEFYALDVRDDKDGIDTIIESILKVAQKENLLIYGCPLNRLNQEMSPIDKDFENAINIIYKNIKIKIKKVLNFSSIQQSIDKDSLSSYIITTVWGALSLSPSNSSQEKYLSLVQHLINYLQSLKN